MKAKSTKKTGKAITKSAKVSSVKSKATKASTTAKVKRIARAKPEPAAKSRTSKSGTRKSKAPKSKAPKSKARKSEAPKSKAPKSKARKSEAPKSEAPKSKAPKSKVVRLVRSRSKSLRNILLAKREAIMTQMREQLGQSLTDDQQRRLESAMDSGDQALFDLEREMGISLQEMRNRERQMIEEALSSLEEGTYGQCAECDAEISEKRLQALPFARYCIECQSRLELLEKIEKGEQRT